jgi:hypothetical protein
MAYDFVSFFFQELLASEIGVQWNVLGSEHGYKEFILFPMGEFIGRALSKNIYIGV